MVTIRAGTAVHLFLAGIGFILLALAVRGGTSAQMWGFVGFAACAALWVFMHALPFL